MDRDTKFDDSGITLLQATGLTAKRTGVRAPWQNGTAERWIGSCRGELLDHMIALNERHLRRLLRDYVSYHHQDWIHDSLGKDTPETRPVEHQPTANANGDFAAAAGRMAPPLSVARGGLSHTLVR